jgi:hypothetical protein
MSMVLASQKKKKITKFWPFNLCAGGSIPYTFTAASYKIECFAPASPFYFSFPSFPD